MNKRRMSRKIKMTQRQLRQNKQKLKRAKKKLKAMSVYIAETQVALSDLMKDLGLNSERVR